MLRRDYGRSRIISPDTLRRIIGRRNHPVGVEQPAMHCAPGANIDELVSRESRLDAAIACFTIGFAAVPAVFIGQIYLRTDCVIVMYGEIEGNSKVRNQSHACKGVTERMMN